MPKQTVRPGKAAEHIVMGYLLAEGIDVYQTLADDQGIDAIIRVKGKKQITYWDLQIKSSQSWSGIRAQISSTSRNYILVLFNSSARECLWFGPNHLKKYFTKNTSSDWGDIFLRKDDVTNFCNKGHNIISSLKDFLGA